MEYRMRLGRRIQAMRENWEIDPDILENLAKASIRVSDSEGYGNIKVCGCNQKSWTVITRDQDRAQEDRLAKYVESMRPHSEVEPDVLEDLARAAICVADEEVRESDPGSLEA